MKKLTWFIILLAVVNLDATAAKENLALEALRIEFETFAQEARYKPFAKAEKQTAKQRIEELYNKKGKVKEHAVFMARHALTVAKMSAEKQYLQAEIDKQDQRLEALNIDTLKTEAQVARLQADRAKLMLNLQAEEVARVEAEKQQAMQLAQQQAQQVEKTQADLKQAQAYAKQQEKVASLAKQEADLAFEEIDSLRKRLESLATRETEEGLVITLGDFVFDSGSANIKQAAIENFGKVTDFMDDYPNRQIRIEGHTDSSGSDALNMKLSKQRASAVKQLLVNYGIKASRMTAVGMGESAPIASNKTKAGKAKNRRVEIIMLK